MGVFDRQIASAKRLIAKYGMSVQWQSIPDATISDPTKPWEVTPATPVLYDVVIAFFPYDRVSAKTARRMDGTEVLIGDEYGIMAAVDFEPSESDVIIRNGKHVKVNAIDKLAPNGEAILYTIDCVL